MANTYTQIRIHIIFSTKNRNPLIPEAHREEVERYMTGIVGALNQKLLAIYCMPDHAHLLVGLNPDISVSELVQKLKANSSKFINQKEWMDYGFAWQKGFGAFSYAKSQTKQVVDYILNQKEHHKKMSFEEEYLGFLEKFDVDYDSKYVLG
ncbi:IS200/IS605 family transposase [Owenweeksia hongkongensis]|uniref:IS200/IS605 family transposase n=1 Tax=Owenweeksia hongkongensis TaxID=253245 RepID=UPI003A8DADFD